MASFRQLDPAQIIGTSTTLRKRIGERFKDSSLEKLARELEVVAKEAIDVSYQVRKPNWTLRGIVIIGMMLMLLILATAISKANIRPDLGGISDFIQGTEAFAQNLAFAGATIYFLLSLEIRRKRNRVLEELHVLRSIAHIVDMHQLTKDPEQLLAVATASSPKRTMSDAELTRYLNYCIEMLVLVSKVAAIYVQDFNDAVSVDAASDVEDLSIGLSRSIWQKIMIMDRICN